uniref:RIH_assoc domain-containing protein n=1 Tax=Parastrongyloides trichosuri TaxID=131310 RepID=A0A0N4ZZK6_PARTI
MAHRSVVQRPRWTTCSAPACGEDGSCAAGLKRSNAAPSPLWRRGRRSGPEWKRGRAVAGAAPFRLGIARSGCAVGRFLFGFRVDQQRLGPALDHLGVDHHFLDAVIGRQFVHGVEQDAFENRTQATGTGLALQCLAGHRLERIAAELQVDAFHLEQLAVLLGQGVLRLGEDLHQRSLVELVEGCQYRQAAYELGNQAKLDQIVRLDFTQRLANLLAFFLAANFRTKADATAGGTVLDDLFEARERTAANEQDVARIDLQELLLRVLAATLRRYRGNRALDQLEQCLLHAFARNVTGDGRVVRLARDLVDFVDVDNAHLGLFHVVVALLQQFLNDVLDIFTDITRFGQRGGIGNGERHIQQTREGFGEQGLTRARRSDQQDVALAELDIVVLLVTLVQALVVVVHRYGQDFFRALLTNDVLVQDAADFFRRRQFMRAALGLGFLHLLTDDVVAQVDALVADKDRGAGNQLAYFMLAFAAEGAIEQFAVVLAVTGVSHSIDPIR